MELECNVKFYKFVCLEAYSNNVGHISKNSAQKCVKRLKFIEVKFSTEKFAEKINHVTPCICDGIYGLSKIEKYLLAFLTWL